MESHRNGTRQSFSDLFRSRYTVALYVRATMVISCFVVLFWFVTATSVEMVQLEIISALVFFGVFLLIAYDDMIRVRDKYQKRQAVEDASRSITWKSMSNTALVILLLIALWVTNFPPAVYPMSAIGLTTGVTAGEATFLLKTKSVFSTMGTGTE